MSEPVLRFTVFLGVFVALALWELAAPRRAAEIGRAARWPGAFILLLIGGVLGRLILPAGLAGLALWADANGFGLFNQIEAPVWLVVIVTFFVLDFAVWLQHVILHRVDFLWRFHRVHHADPHFDVTTALRFHPGEIALSLIWKSAVVVLIGAPALAALAFELALNAMAQFNHSNIRLPARLDAALRHFVVTPDMHRVHHSTDHIESNRNFGFCLSVWDKLFRVYKAQPDQSHQAMPLGQSKWRAAGDQRPDRLLTQPFR